MDEWLTLVALQAGDHAMRKIGFMIQDERPYMVTAPDRKVVQISTMMHPEKD